jgi:hypothetical protein
MRYTPACRGDFRALEKSIAILRPPLNVGVQGLFLEKVLLSALAVRSQFLPGHQAADGARVPEPQILRRFIAREPAVVTLRQHQRLGIATHGLKSSLHVIPSCSGRAWCPTVCQRPEHFWLDFLDAETQERALDHVRAEAEGIDVEAVYAAAQVAAHGVDEVVHVLGHDGTIGSDDPGFGPVFRLPLLRSASSSARPPTSSSSHRASVLYGRYARML